MDSVNFCYWLQGALELGKADGFDVDSVQIIQDHLDLVFNKVTPVREVKRSNIEILQDVIDKHKGTTLKPFDFPRPYIGKPPFDFTNPPVITC